MSMNESDTTTNDQDTLSEATESNLPASEPTGAHSSNEDPNAAQELSEPHEDTQESSKASPALRKARKEAASYRERARDAETRSEALQARVEQLEWAEVERHLPTDAPKLEGLKKLGLELDEVKDDDGNVDPAKVHEATVAAAEMVGIEIKKSQGPVAPLEGRSPDPHKLLPASVEAKLAETLGIKQ